MFKQTSTSLILLGILSVIVGIIAFAWPGVTVYALVLLFAVYAFIDAGLEAARAFSSRTAGPVFGHLLLGLISLAAGVVAVVWPGPTALVLVLVIGIWAVAGGIVEIVAGFGHGETAGTRAMFILTGLVSAAFGVVLFAGPAGGWARGGLLCGCSSLIGGTGGIPLGAQLPHRPPQHGPARPPPARGTAPGKPIRGRGPRGRPRCGPGRLPALPAADRPGL